MSARRCRLASPACSIGSILLRTSNETGLRVGQEISRSRQNTSSLSLPGEGTVVSRTMVRAAGAFNLAYGLFHLFFWPFLSMAKLAEDYSRVPILLHLMRIANASITVILLGFALLFFLYADEMLSTRLGRSLLWGGVIFWVARAIEQLVYIPWQYQNPMSIVFTSTFVVGAALHAAAAFGAKPQVVEVAAES